MDQMISSSAGMLRTNLRGQIRQTPLPKWKALLPLFEAVMNSFQAIHDSKAEHQHKITISVEREDGLLEEDYPPIVGFTITDTGVGFDDDNFDSFNTAFSEHKVDRGGKGLGRFMWLKAFDTVDISSVFSTHDPEEERELWNRSFKFDVNYDPEKAAPVKIKQGVVGTTIKLGGFKKVYREHCPLQVEKLAQRLAEHFILVLMQAKCPRVEIHDQGVKTSLNTVFRENFKDNSATSSFALQGRNFTINGFRLSSRGASKHRLIYAANSRGVITEMLDQYIPNLSSRLIDEDGESFVYLAVVQGDYLNEKVNNFRTDFEIQDTVGDELELELEDVDIKRSEIRNECTTFIENDLSSLIDDLNRVKIEKLKSYVHVDAPQYKPLMRYVIDFVGEISPNATKMEMELALHKELHKREVSLKRESKRILTQGAKLDDYE
ncbi:MAG: ATP-binding protein, partial [Pseudomonadota bacterium]